LHRSFGARFRKIIFLLIIFTFNRAGWTQVAPNNQLRAGAAAVAITPFGANSDWDGTITASGVWGEKFTDTNHNGGWDKGEPFEDDPGNTAIDANSRGKYDGIYIAGYGYDRLATGKHDDLWARALVLESGPTRIAIVAVDLIGYYSHAGYYGLTEVKKFLDPKLNISEILISSTHDHEAPDTIGLWGANPLSDGKYPKYMRFVDRQIAKAITQAARSIVPCRMKLGRTDPQLSASLVDMEDRDRPPKFVDPELRVMHFVAANESPRPKVVATLINWNAHPESMSDQNTLLTSDFPDGLRHSVEQKFGGTAVYISGDLGAVTVVGSNDDKGPRTRFDGREFPRVSASNDARFARTEAIGREVAMAVFDAVQRGEWSTVSAIEIKKAELSAPMDNAGYSFVMAKGVLNALPPPRNGEAQAVRSLVYAISLGDAQIVTVPGELIRRAGPLP
jgi:hypothetical protein